MKPPPSRRQLPVPPFHWLLLCLAALACSVLSPAGTRLITTAVPVTEARIASPTAPTAGAEMAVLAPENLSAGDLRQTMGDEAFKAGLRAYFEQYGGTASDAEFQAVLEEAAGQSLEAVFVKWLE